MKETHPNIAKNTCYIDTQMKIEVLPKRYPMKREEVPVCINVRNIYSGIRDEYRFRDTEHMNGGLVRQPVLDGAGRSSFEWVFTGNAKKAQDGGEWGDTCDAIADPKLSLGSNNMVVEAKLRRTKAKLNYKEPERRGGFRHRRGRF